MPYNLSRSAQFYDKEILKYPQMDLVAKSIVIDGNSVPMNADGSRTVLEAGTIMKVSATIATRHAPYDGSGTIVGILKTGVDFLATATAGSEPAAVYFHDAIFDVTKIVGYTAYATAVEAALPSCLFE